MQDERVLRGGSYSNSKAVFLQVLMRYVYMDGFTVRIDDVVNMLILADMMYQLEGHIKWLVLAGIFGEGFV